MTRVFISSSSLDAEFVEREIVSLLKRHGVEAWYSKDSIETAAEWEKRIKHGLNACEWFLVVLSPRAVASDWVQSEVNWAVEKRRGKVIPVLYEDCDPDELHLKLRRIQYIDFRRATDSARRKLLAVWGLADAAEAEQAFSRAVRAIAKQEWGEAVAQLKAELTRSPDNAEARTLLAYAEQQQAAGMEAAAAGQDTFADELFPFKQTVLWMPKKPGVSKGTNGEGVDVVVTQEVLLGVSHHVAQTLDHEVGGFLIGNCYRCPETGREFIIIDHTSPAKFTEAADVSLSFTLEDWSRLNDALRVKFRGKLLVGWYHSHPRMDVFLSRYDMDIQQERFAEPWMTALVLEPEQHRGGFFCWRGGSVSPTEPVEFYELLERNSRESVVAWENYTGVDLATHQRPTLKRNNTATVGSPAAERPAPPRRLPLVKDAPEAVDLAPPPQTRAKRLLGWLAIGAALLIGFASIWAFIKMSNADGPVDNNGTALSANRGKAAAASEARQPEEAGVELVPVEALAISKVEDYELVKGRENTFRVRMFVDNAPAKVQVEMGEVAAKVTGYRKAAGGQNRREVLADVPFTRELEAMRRNPAANLPVLVKVSDGDDPENYELLELNVVPAKLGLTGASATARAGPVKVAEGESKMVSRGQPRSLKRPE